LLTAGRSTTALSIAGLPLGVAWKLLAGEEARSLLQDAGDEWDEWERLGTLPAGDGGSNEVESRVEKS
jgi:hypothetical protein